MTWKHRPDNKNPKYYNVTREDCNSAAKGLNMLSMNTTELKSLIDSHKGKQDVFASQVIVTSARQILEVKRFNCAE